MSNNAAVSNQELIAAILSSTTLTEAANKTGISIRCLHNRMHEPDFRIAYTDAKNEIMRKAIAQIHGHLYEALETVTSIMSNPDNNPQVRLQAAQTLINTMTKFKDYANAAEVNFYNGH